MADPRFPLSTQTNIPATASNVIASNLKPATIEAPLRSTATAPSPGMFNEPVQSNLLGSSTYQAAPVLSSSSFTNAAPLNVQSSSLPLASGFNSGYASSPTLGAAPLGVQSSTLGVQSSSLPLASGFNSGYASSPTLGAAPLGAQSSTLPLSSGYATGYASSPTLGAAPIASGSTAYVSDMNLNAAPITTTRESFPNPKETVITKETIIPGVYRDTAIAAPAVAPATSWREAAVVTNFQEKPIVTEVIEKPSLEIHRQQHITEIHERPQVVFQEQPLIVQERAAPQVRRIAEQIVTEDRRDVAVAVANPYLGVQPHFVREAEIRSEVNEGSVLKQVIEKPSVEVHQQPIVTEVIERPAVEIREQEIIRKFRDAPTVVRSTSPVQYVSVEQARAMGILVPPTNLVEGVARMEIAPQPVFIHQPELIKPATVLTEEVHTVTHPVGRAHIPLGAEIVSTTDPNLKPEVGHVHGNLPATGATTTTTASPGVMGKVKNALGLGHKTTTTTY